MHMLDMCKFREQTLVNIKQDIFIGKPSTYFVAKFGTFQCICSDLYLNQMSDNKKAHYIHQFMGKHPHKIKPIVKIYAAPANVLKNYKLVYEYVFV